MTTLTPTHDTGGASRPSEALYVQPGREVTDETLTAAIDISGVNVPFVADFLSAVLTHERCGHHLYRAVTGRSNNPVLKRRYGEFGAETMRHVELLEELIVISGGNPNYVSPMARAVEAMDAKLVESTFLTSGTADPMLEEKIMLDAVFIAESVDHDNWLGMRALGAQLPEGELRTAFIGVVEQVLVDEDIHLSWAQETRNKLTLLQAESSMLAKGGAMVEEAVEKVRGWLF